MLRLMITRAAALTALLIGVTPGGHLLAQSAAPSVVTVSIVDDYPAFHPEISQRHPGARPLRALVFQRDLARGDSAVILLHPVHADPETVRDALAILKSRANRSSGAGERSPIPLLASGSVRPVEPALRARLSAKLAELHAMEKTPTGNLGRVGRSIVLTEVSQYSPGS